LARMTIPAAGLLLSSALLLSAVASVRAASDCKAAQRNGACPTPKDTQPHILPNPAPVAKPRPPPPAVGHLANPAAPKQANNKPSQPQPKTRHGVRHRAYAEAAHGYRHASRQEWGAYDSWWAIPHQEQRPPSGPIYESGPAAGGCDEACRYDDWFRRYNDWYDRYGGYYRSGQGSAMNVHPNSSHGPARGDTGLADNYRGRPLDQSERDRMDPWHGYNSRDGIENGY
jgi:hypothetical protein